MVGIATTLGLILERVETHFRVACLEGLILVVVAGERPSFFGPLLWPF